MTTMISIDWDFFLWRGNEASEPVLSTCDNGTLSVGTVAQLFDWGHNEGHHPSLQHVLWISRYAGLLRAGVVPEDATGFRGVTPRDFCSDLRSRGIGEPLLMAGDSHALGYKCAAHMALTERGRRRRTVIHFDAHHDLGYAGVYAQKKAGQTDCGAWLWHALDRKLVTEVLVVYPDWRDDDDWENLLTAKHMRRFRDKVARMSWSEWRASQVALGDVSIINLARSSAWSPPWFDKDFEKLVSLLPKGRYACLDCEEGRTGHHACAAREWDSSAARALADAETATLHRMATGVVPSGWFARPEDAADLGRG